MLITLTGGPPHRAHHTRRNLLFQSLAESARAFDLEVAVASPLNFHGPHTKRLHGYAYTAKTGDGRYEDKTVSIRHPVVYDAMYLSDLKLYRVPYRRCLAACTKARIPWFNPVFPGKDVIYRHLPAGSLRHGTLPQTEYNVTGAKVVRMLNQVDSLWLKPIVGSGGRNIAFVERIGEDTYRVTAERFYGRRIRAEIDEKQLLQLMAWAQTQRVYLAQENVPLLTTSEGQKVDFRMTVQRNDTGKWQATAVTARIGSAGGVLTNYHAGGRVLSLTFLSQQSRNFIQELGVTVDSIRLASAFALSVAKALQRQYPNLGMLGVDVGLTSDGRLYVYDCNGRPGRDILTNAEVERFMHAVAGYARYLEDKKYVRKADH